MEKTKRIRTFYWLIGVLTAILIGMVGILVMPDKKCDKPVPVPAPDGTEELLTAKYLYGGTGPTLKSADGTNYRPGND